MASIRCRLARLPEESPNAVALVYLAEGAANIVFSIQKSQTQHPVVFEGPRRILYHPTVFNAFVMRISKGLDKTLDGRQVYHDFEHEIQPLFDTRSTPNFLEHLLSLWMVALDPSVHSGLNEEIETRSSRYKGPIPTDSVGLIMENMSTSQSQHTLSVTIELKPKWLAQSPNAPPGSVRCRTCALQASKEHKGISKKDAYICPLNLIDAEANVLEPFILLNVQEATRGQVELQAAKEQAIAHTMAHYLEHGKGYLLMQHIRTKQCELDPHGVLGPYNPHDLRLAMTLRDCSLFLRYVENEHGTEVQARLGDLDFKSAEKMDDWAKKEEQLIAGGWYKGHGNPAWAYGTCRYME
ncbi:hypothetical protein M011DRAFT_246034 [Sporormia fimetaria CBS 119925]|uniref:Inositol-pentakisphosphate 2-kinase n=1 Tax=Sporormia fimetaria CBS 119925 TaxID=1340428 RepID=A0A6A6V1K0_9PLEO|nr:hypothetical protein M011DRAFT_246034 [Sporormia fimetaria CBS 119925]